MAKIMVVEDSKFIGESVKLMLAKRGHEIIVALGARIGMRKLKKALPDLIILDLMMPDMSGDEMFRILKKDEKTKDIPVVILTAKTDALDRDSFLRKADAFIPKPFEKKELIDRVEQCLKLYKAKKRIQELRTK